jgi:hypothetical protein
MILEDSPAKCSFAGNEVPKRSLGTRKRSAQAGKPVLPLIEQAGALLKVPIPALFV